MPNPDDALLWTAKPPTHRQPKPGELLFEFVRRDGTPMRCELRFHGETYGWEAQFIEASGHEFYAHGGFVMRELAVRWAERERHAMTR